MTIMRVNNFVPLEEVFNSNIEGVKKTEESNGEFSSVLKDSLDKINNQQIIADNATESFIKGEDIDISEVMLLGAEAGASLQFAVQVRNKLVEAYQEISRMQL